ncbi:MAG: hypothetical protein QM572_11945 [Nocardioides sp.]|uniref:hypothetical protein n=1 Tax=Nocardioides sp. TaxID=35761 RepID=UPI0039E6E087
MTYAETGALLRSELAALLREHRIQQRIGGGGVHTVPVTATVAEREEIGRQIRSYRQAALVWCHQASTAALPGAASALQPTGSDPFRLPERRHNALEALDRSVGQARHASSTALPSLADLTTPHTLDMVEHWRHVARAAALGEHDFTAGLGHGSLDASQLRTLVGDVAATVQALVVLDQRYAAIPGWERLHHPDRLGWSALACAMDASLEPPDYSIDMRGWQPPVKPIRGPAKPGLLGVLQAEHNLTVRMKSFPNATNLRLIVDSQIHLTGRLAQLASALEPDLARTWSERTETYRILKQELRNIGGRAGVGGLAAAEAANAVSRLNGVRPEHVDPRALHAFTTLFTRLDHRIADVIETGINRQTYFTRVTLPRLVQGTGSMVAPVRERYVPLAETDHTTLSQLINRQLRPPAVEKPALAAAARSRADLHAALVHRPNSRGATSDVPTI